MPAYNVKFWAVECHETRTQNPIGASADTLHCGVKAIVGPTQWGWGNGDGPQTFTKKSNWSRKNVIQALINDIEGSAYGPTFVVDPNGIDYVSNADLREAINPGWTPDDGSDYSSQVIITAVP